MANLVILNGRLGADLVLKHTNDGDAVANFSIATTATWNDRRTGERKQRTEWHQCVAWGKRAESYAKHMKKGKKYYLTGSLETTSYEKDGQTHYATKIRVDVVEY